MGDRFSETAMSPDLLALLGIDTMNSPPMTTWIPPAVSGLGNSSVIETKTSCVEPAVRRRLDRARKWEEKERESELVEKEIGQRLCDNLSPDLLINVGITKCQRRKCDVPEDWERPSKPGLDNSEVISPEMMYVGDDAYR